MIVNQRMLLSFDSLLFLAVLCLTGIGILLIWSTIDAANLDAYLGRQFLYVGLSLVCFLIVLYFDYHTYSDFIALMYGAGMGILGLVLLVGRSVHGNKSWIHFGSFSFQPSEIMKILVIVALAKYYSESEREYLDFHELLTGALIAFAPMLLVTLQGDLGTAVTFVPIYVALSFLAGLKKRHLVAFVLAGALIIPVGWQLLLKDYQKGRIQTVFNPSNDPRRLGYQTIQSEIAIGSGGFLGKGFRQGSQSRLGFLPARHTDFVFAVWSEEKGFLGSISILGLFLFLAIRLMRAAREAKDKIGTMIILGVLALIIFHVTINVGMVVGLLPIAGIPLPFVSVGGSSLISCFVAIGLCVNISMRRYVN